MRSYPADSPQAAARMVAVALIADGHLSREELAALDCCDAREQLGISQAQLHDVVRALCEDLLATSSGDWAAACRLDVEGLAALAREVRDPALRLKVLQLCIAAVVADGRVDHAESAILRALAREWVLDARSPAGA